VGDLRQDPDAVSHFSGGVLACPVLQLLHDVQCIVQNLMVFSAVNIYNTSDAAGIVFLLVPHNISSSGGYELLPIQCPFIAFKGTGSAVFSISYCFCRLSAFLYPLRALNWQFSLFLTVFAILVPFIKL
jgi:hypothetical protein